MNIEDISESTFLEMVRALEMCSIYLGMQSGSEHLLNKVNVVLELAKEDM